MAGISDLNSECLWEIFENLKLMDLYSMRQCSKRFRDFADDYFRSLYFVQEEWLDLKKENTANVEKILNNFGRYVRYLQVGEKTEENMRPNNTLDVIANNCNILKGLSLIDLRLSKIDIHKFAGAFANLNILELTRCTGSEKCNRDFLLGLGYPNLETLIIKSFGTDEKQDEIKKKVLKTFFMRKRKIKELKLYMYVNDDLLSLIALNAMEIEKLRIWPEVKNDRDLMSLAQLRKLKHLGIDCEKIDSNRSIIAFIKQLSINNSLERLKLDFFEFTDECFDALSNLTHLKNVLFWEVSFDRFNDTKSIEMLSHKLTNLESLALAHCTQFPYRAFLESFCKSDKLRTIYIWQSKFEEINNFIDQILKDFVHGKSHRCVFLGNHLSVYLHEEMFDRMKDLVSQKNLKSIEKYRNIKLFRCNRADFPMYFFDPENFIY